MDTIYGFFIIVLNLAFYVVLFAFMLRMLFQLFRVDARNEVALKIAHVTNPMVLYLRNYLPRTRYIDLSTLACWLIIDVVKYTVIMLLSGSSLPSFFHYLMLPPCDFIMQACSIIFYATLFYAVVSFVAPGLQSMGMDTLRALSEPALKQARKIISPAGGFDFAPIIVLLITKFSQVAITKVIPAGFFY